MVYKENTIYKNGGDGGGSNIDIDFSRPVFVNQLTEDDTTLNYDARLENILYKLPPEYKKVRGIRNITSMLGHAIYTGISTDDGENIEMIAAFWITNWVQYGQIISNTYIDTPVHMFGISCGSGGFRISCFVNTNYSSLPNNDFQNGSAICLRQTGNDRIAKDVFYPYTNHLAPSSTGEANTSEIFMYGSALVTIFSLYIKKGGVVVRDFIPCVRISDDVPGFYDKVSNMFFTNDDPSMLAAVYP